MVALSYQRGGCPVHQVLSFFLLGEHIYPEVTWLRIPYSFTAKPHVIRLPNPVPCVLVYTGYVYIRAVCISNISS